MQLLKWEINDISEWWIKNERRRREKLEMRINNIFKLQGNKLICLIFFKIPHISDIV